MKGTMESSCSDKPQLGLRLRHFFIGACSSSGTPSNVRNAKPGYDVLAAFKDLCLLIVGLLRCEIFPENQLIATDSNHVVNLAICQV